MQKKKCRASAAPSRPLAGIAAAYCATAGRGSVPPASPTCRFHTSAGGSPNSRAGAATCGAESSAAEVEGESRRRPCRVVAAGWREGRRPVAPPPLQIVQYGTCSAPPPSLPLRSFLAHLVPATAATTPPPPAPPSRERRPVGFRLPPPSRASTAAAEGHG